MSDTLRHGGAWSDRDGVVWRPPLVELTDAEREAVEWFAEVRKPLDSLDGGEYVAALRALRERIGREVFDMLCAANAPKQERTPATHATPAQGSVAGPVKRQVFLRKNMTNDAPPTWQEEVAAVEDAFERSGVHPTWPDDEPGNIGPMAAAMADEIARLRLTDAERDAVETCIADDEAMTHHSRAATLRGLLERLGGGE